jgi:hypothetical protein
MARSSEKEKHGLEARARRALDVCASDFPVDVNAYPFRSILTRTWPVNVAALLIADPGAVFEASTIEAVQAIIAGGQAVVLCSVCPETRDRVRRGLIGAAQDAAAAGRA